MGFCCVFGYNNRSDQQKEGSSWISQAVTKPSKETNPTSSQSIHKYGEKSQAVKRKSGSSSSLELTEFDGPPPTKQKQPQPESDDIPPTKQKQPSVVESFDRAALYKQGGQKAVQISKALTFMIVKDDLPFRTPEKEGLRVYTRKLNALYQMPAEKTVTKKIEESYVALRKKAMADLATAEAITLTTDIWTHKHTMASYLGVTAHFARGVEIVSLELAAHPMKEKKTIENLRECLRKICADWGIQKEKIVAVVTDGGANIKGAVKQEFGDTVHINCFAHSINGIGQTVIELHKISKIVLPSLAEGPGDSQEDEEMGDTGIIDDPDLDSESIRSFLNAIKKIVRFFRSSEVATNELLQLQQDDGVHGLRLIQEVCTRWNSCFEMLERFLKLSDVISRVLFKLKRKRIH